MSNRKQRANIAAETLDIINRGTYTVDDVVISIQSEMTHACLQTRLYMPWELESLLQNPQSTQATQLAVDVENCTTFAAAQRLMKEGFEDVCCLNFASAKNPGGGFLGGSQAQEESLARASGLYQTLLTQMAYYEVNRACSTSLYTHHVIYSPQVPVFRDDEDQLLREPYRVSFMTAPAVNAGAVRRNEPHRILEIETVMRQRIASVLMIARHQGHEALVLGAWGCGVFANNPQDVAQWFRDALESPQFQGVFERIIFAVLDNVQSTPTFDAFHQVWSAFD